MRKLLASVALAAAVAVPQIGRAADAESTSPNTGALSLSGGMDLVTAYVFRGAEVSDTGVILQPWAQLNAAAYKSDSLTITPYIGFWNDIQSVEQAPSTSEWFELDAYGGVDFGVGDFTIGAIYTFYTYPGNAFQTIQELGFKVSYNDSKLCEKAGLPIQFKPYAAWYLETDDPNGASDQYVELGVNPTIPLKDSPFSFNFPLTVGLSPDGYFLTNDGNNEPFGYVSIGAFANYALPFASKWGAWNLYAGATYYYLNASSLKHANGEDTDYQLVGKAGIAFVY